MNSDSYEDKEIDGSYLNQNVREIFSEVVTLSQKSELCVELSKSWSKLRSSMYRGFRACLFKELREVRGAWTKLCK